MSLLKKSSLWVGVSAGLLSESAVALAPPTQDALNGYLFDGTLTQRMRRAYQLGNNKVNPALLQSMRRRFLRAQGIDAGDQHAAPPSAWQGGLPTSGSPKVLVLLVDFPDVKHTDTQTVKEIELKMFGKGDSADKPYESLTAFYQRSSYGKLDIKGKVLDWYTAKNNRSYYEELDQQTWQDGSANDELIKEALEYHDKKGHDFSQYDSDTDGAIDALFIKWTGEDNGWSGFWWAYQWQVQDESYTVDGKKVRKYVWSWYENEPYNGVAGYVPRVDIHETGHLLGLPDYYDYESWYGPEGGVGRLDMMDSNWGDHNCFSKSLLDWITPTVVSSETQAQPIKPITLKPSGTEKLSTGDQVAVQLVPKGAKSDIFGEFFMAQYRKNGVGNDPDDYPANGMLIWHIDARLNSAGNNFRYNNSYTAHKLLRLVEADGLGDIARSVNSRADAGDFYQPGQSFGPRTIPNSRSYTGASTGVTIDEITTPGETITARFRVGELASAVSCAPSAIQNDATVSDTWTANCLSSERAGSAAGFYTFDVPAGAQKKVTINLRSEKADTYLLLRHCEATPADVTRCPVEDRNDDAEGSSNAQITKELTAGTYMIEATTYLARQVGAYTLTFSMQ